MTSNQIAYWSLQEDKRHNVTTEGETQRHNMTSESIDLGRLNESRRHNVATEGIQRDSLNETIRHNKASEGIDIGRLQETTRHNVAQEALGSQNISLGYSQLQESIRHSKETEGQGWFNAYSQQQLRQAQTTLAETEATWKNVLNDQTIDLNQAKIDEINARIEQINNMIDISWTQVDQKYMDQILTAVGELRRLVDVFE